MSKELNETIEMLKKLDERKLHLIRICIENMIEVREKDNKKPPAPHLAGGKNKI